MNKLELFSWQSLVELKGRKSWYTDPNMYSTFEECYNFGIENLTEEDRKLLHRIVLSTFDKALPSDEISSQSNMSITPFFYLIKELSNA